jgi:hypothetical protein
MAQSKFTLYKCVKLDDGAWRYKRAAFYSNGKIKPNIVVVAHCNEYAGAVTASVHRVARRDIPEREGAKVECGSSFSTSGSCSGRK